MVMVGVGGAESFSCQTEQLLNGGLCLGVRLDGHGLGWFRKSDEVMRLLGLGLFEALPANFWFSKHPHFQPFLKYRVHLNILGILPFSYREN